MYQYFEELRDSKGVKNADVAKATGLNATLFSEWKKGKAQPKADKLQKIADYFGVSIERLTTGKDTEKESTDGTKWYFSDDTARLAQEAHDNPDLRVLFDAARDARPEDIQLATEMLRRFKATNPDG